MPLAAMILGTFVAEIWERRGKAALLADLLTWTSLGLGVTAAVVATCTGLWSFGAAAAALLGLAGLGLCFSWARRRLSEPHRWAASAATTLLILLVGASQLLPAYHRRFSLRGQVRRHAADSAIPVVCYPRRWDGVGFYLGRADILTHQDCAALIADLQTRDQTLAFIKNRDYLDRFLQALPPSLEFVPGPRQGPNVTSGLVRRRDALVGPTFLAAEK
jgi:hypothetical protein